MSKRINKSDAVRVLEKAERLKKRELKRTIFVPGPDRGDRLARGASSATYGNGDIAVSNKQWDRAFLTDEEFEAKYGKPNAKKEKV
jgi:hypothetical protein